MQAIGICRFVVSAAAIVFAAGAAATAQRTFVASTGCRHESVQL